MAVSDLNYYLVTSKIGKCNIGDILQVQDKIALDIEKKISFPFNEKFPVLPKLTVEQLNMIIKFKGLERISASKMIRQGNNTYFQKSTLSAFLGKHSNSIIRWFLIPTEYCCWKEGSIFVVADTSIFECDMMNGGVISGSIPKSWIEITKNIYKILKGKKRCERLQYYQKYLKNQVSSSIATTNMLPIETKVSSELTANKPIASLPDPVNIQPQNQYFESTVIIPNSVINVTKMTFDGWAVDDKVYFILIESGCRYDGIIRWMGCTNGINSAAVEVRLLLPNNPLLKYQCPRNLCLRLQLNNFVSIYLIRLSAIHKSVAKYDFMAKYFNKMFSSLEDGSLASEIFRDAEKLNDPAFLNSLSNDCPQSFIFDLCLKLLSPTSVYSSYNMPNLQRLIMKIPATENCNLLKLAKESLRTKKEEMFVLLTSKCSDKNIYLNNGETFLTDLIKSSDVNQDIINIVLRKGIFDINKPNRVNESPLSLVCGRLFTDSVRILVNNNCNVDHNNGKALEVVFAAKKRALNLGEMSKVIEIIEILTTATKPEINICTICMDKKINVVFDCGHNSCKDCSTKLAICHMCKKNIETRIPLFLA